MVSIAALGATALLGCGGATGITESSGGTAPTTQTPPPPEWVRTERLDDLPPESATVVSRGTSPSLARAAASEALGVTIFGERPDPRLGELPDVATAEAIVEREAALPEGEHAVLLSLPRPAMEALFERILTSASDPPEGTPPPEPLRGHVNALRSARAQAFVCSRRRALFGEECEAPDFLPLEEAVGRFVEELELLPFYVDGQPTRPDGEFLRPITLVVGHRGDDRPLPGIPIRLERSDAPEAALAASVSDEEGVVRLVAPPEEEEGESGAEGNLVARLDRIALLGSEAPAAPPRTLAIEERVVPEARVAAHLVERSGGSLRRDGSARRALLSSLEEGGADLASSLSEEWTERLRRARGEELRVALAELADHHRGRIDRVILGEVESRFASRMSSRAVWYEATLEARVYDVWTGERVGSVDLRTTASGLGDDRADREARSEAGRELAERLLNGSLRRAPVGSAVGVGDRGTVERVALSAAAASGPRPGDRSIRRP